MSYRQRKKQPKAPTPRQRIGDYRIFVGAFPTGELADQIQAVREDVDAKTAVITAPHVTLAGTYWRMGKPNKYNETDSIKKLSLLSETFAPFTMQLGGIYTFGSRVIYLGVKPTDEMLAIRRSLTNVLGRDKHRQFRPHLTLAMRLSKTEFPQVLEQLQETEWHNGRYSAPITQLHLMLRGPKDPAWRTIHTIDLQGVPKETQPQNEPDE